jgi:hypothetical protein
MMISFPCVLTSLQFVRVLLLGTGGAGPVVVSATTLGMRKICN